MPDTTTILLPKPPTLSNTGMTAREIYNSPKANLHGLASQYRFIMERYNDEPIRCPSCGLAQTIVEAAGHTLDTYPWSKSLGATTLRCRNQECMRPLLHQLSIVGISTFSIDFERERKR